MSDRPRNEADGDGRHYSYRHYASRDVAERFDRLRFGGPVGEWLLETQAALLSSALAPRPGRRIVDVGTGTGRAALALVRAGAHVTGVDASAEMLKVASTRLREAKARAALCRADAHLLPFADRAFDAAVSLRVLMHTPDWRQCVAELCRVARWRVVVDFPAASSVAALESLARRAAAAAGRPVEAYRVMREGAVADALARHGFRVVAVERQCVLPIALHKRWNRLAASLRIERALASVGLRRLAGSPVTMVAER